MFCLSWSSLLKYFTNFTLEQTLTIHDDSVLKKFLPSLQWHESNVEDLVWHHSQMA